MVKKLFSMKNSRHSLKNSENIDLSPKMRQKVIYFLQVPENLKLRQIFQSPESENVEVFDIDKILSVCINLTRSICVKCWPKLDFLYMCTGKGNRGREHTIVTK